MKKIVDLIATCVFDFDCLLMRNLQIQQKLVEYNDYIYLN